MPDPMKSSRKVIAVVGPTAVGKTQLGITIAEIVGGEVISADSRQVYRGLNLGTGKVTKEEARGVPHHLIDVVDPKEIFTAYDYMKLGERALLDIEKRGAVPVIVGGTGFYIDALLGRIELSSVPPNETLRESLASKSTEDLVNELETLNPERASKIDVKNRVRVLRALEVTLSESITTHVAQARIENSYEVLWIGLTLPRDELKMRIKDRLRTRFDEGMLEEARELHSVELSFERMEELGLEYRYMARHLQGFLSYDKMVEELEHKIYQYAKRQMTWFKKNKSILWFDARETESVVTRVKLFLR